MSLIKKKNFDVALYGNLIIDLVSCVEQFNLGTSNLVKEAYKTVGSIGNMLRAAKETNPALKIAINSAIGVDDAGHFVRKWFANFRKLYLMDINTDNLVVEADGKTSTAHIIAELARSQRTSVVNWGSCRAMGNFEPRSSRWNHIMYLDTLDNISDMDLHNMRQENPEVIISADLCLGFHTPEQKRKIYSMFKYIDYLIISDVEANSVIDNKNSNASWRSYDKSILAKMLGEEVKEVAIIHSPKDSVVSDGQTVKFFEATPVASRNMNVLGAGDIFATSFICAMLNEGEVWDSVEFAHHNTAKILEGRK